MDIFLDKLYLFFAKIYLAKGKHKTVVVTGSVGKTSTTQAIATALSSEYIVMATKHNYNSHRGAPLTIFELDIPPARIGWAMLTVRAALKAIFGRPKFDMLVLELGSDKPGDVAKFAFLRPDIAVVTAVTPEHMEFFKTIDAVAAEELSVSKYSRQLLVNADLIADQYLAKYVRATDVLHYSSKDIVCDVGGMKTISIGDTKISSANWHLISRAGDTVLVATACVANILGMKASDIATALEKVLPVAGRMNNLAGKNGSVIIDDTYNSSPEAVRAALDYIYEQDFDQKIVVLGNMNEMGEESMSLHAQVGSWCDPRQIELLVTIGPDANKYLAVEAEKKGCRVVRVNTPYQAGELVLPLLKPGTVVLAKGSQNNVYLEEAVKYWLADAADETSLTRQHTYWPAKKAKCFTTQKA